MTDLIGRGFAVGAEILLILFMAWPGGSTAQTAALKPDAERVLVDAVIPGHPIGVPKVLLSQLKKDLGNDEFLPKTVDLLARQLNTEKLSLVDPRGVRSSRSFPQDAEFYWLWGPAAFCGSGGCATQLYWTSPSSASAGRLFPGAGPENAVSFNKSPTVLTRSTNGLFDLSLFEASDSQRTRPLETTLTFDGQQYVVRTSRRR